MNNDELLNLIILQRQVEWQYQLDQFTDASLGQIRQGIHKAQAQVLDYIADRGEGLTVWGEQRANAILNEMDKLTFGIRGQLVDNISDISSVVGERALGIHNDILSFGGRVAKFNTTLLSAAQLKSIVLNTPVGGNLLHEWVNRTFTSNLQESIKEDILAGMLRGKGYKGLMASVEEGFQNISRREAITLTRTYVQSANVGAMEMTYRENSDIVKKVKWSSTLEGGGGGGRGTCIRCACLDGEVYLIDDHPPCPLHPRCFVDGQTKIYTSRGWKQIRDIKVGNLVLTHKGRFRKVTELIFTPRQKPKVTKIFVKFGSRKDFITATDEHPIMANGSWKGIKDVKVGDKVSVLASKCRRCGKKIPYYRTYCSWTCNSKDITDRQWADPIHRELMSRKTSEQLRREYGDGTRDPFKVTEACHEKNRELAKQGLMSLQRSDVREKIKQVTNLPHHRKASSERMKANNPSLNPEVRKRMTETFKRTMLEEPDRNGNRALALKGGFASKYENEFDKIIKTFGIEYDRQYPILNYFADFAIPNLKIAIEIDGEHHKWDGVKENDQIRTNRIESNGWTVLRFSNDRVENDTIGIKDELKRVFMNHNGEYDFIELEVVKTDNWELKKARTLYNFSVEEDESYIAKGFVVHNCRCILLPVTVSYKELGLDMDEIKDVYRPYTIRPSEAIDLGRRKKILEVGFHDGDYASFYMSRGTAFQKNVVGPVRQGLIADGDIAFKELVNLNTGRMLRLDELGFTRSGGPLFPGVGYAPIEKAAGLAPKGLDQWGFKIGSKQNLFTQSIFDNPMSWDDTLDLPWNAKRIKYKGAWSLLKKKGLAKELPDGRMTVKAIGKPPVVKPKIIKKAVKIDIEDLGSGEFVSRAKAEGGKIAATMTYELDDTGAFIKFIRANDEYLGKGYGSALVDDLIAKAQAKGLKTLSGESISPSLRVILDKRLGKPRIIGPKDYWKKELEGIEVTYKLPKPIIPKVKPKSAFDELDVFEKKVAKLSKTYKAKDWEGDFDSVFAAYSKDLKKLIDAEGGVDRFDFNKFFLAKTRPKEQSLKMLGNFKNTTGEVERAAEMMSHQLGNIMGDDVFKLAIKGENRPNFIAHKLPSDEYYRANHQSKRLTFSGKTVKPEIHFDKEIFAPRSLYHEFGHNIEMLDHQYYDYCNQFVANKVLIGADKHAKRLRQVIGEAEDRLEKVEVRMKSVPENSPVWKAQSAERKVLKKDLEEFKYDLDQTEFDPLGHRIKKLKDLTNANYDENELAWIDDFWDAYIGKVMDNASEVYSMGIQNFTTGKNMASFAMKDFDHFSLTYGILSDAMPSMKTIAAKQLASSKKLIAKSPAMVEKAKLGLTNNYLRVEGKWLLNGEDVAGAVMKRLDDMKLPPAWTDVIVSVDPKSKIQAIGLDKSGRWQYRYSAEHMEKAAKEKFDRLKLFHKDIGSIRAEIARGMKKNDPRAFLLNLEDKTAIRAGSAKDFKAKIKAYGLTTLQNEHVIIKGNEITLNFIAKEGVSAEYKLVDKKLASWLKKRKAATKAGDKLFGDTNASSLNTYLKEISGGKDFSIKDFRTFHGTRIAYEKLKPYMTKVLDVKEKKKVIKEVTEKVSKFLHNTPTMAKNYYIDPMVWDMIGADIAKQAPAEAVKKIVKKVGKVIEVKKLKGVEKSVLDVIKRSPVFKKTDSYLLRQGKSFRGFDKFIDDLLSSGIVAENKTGKLFWTKKRKGAVGQVDIKKLPKPKGKLVKILTDPKKIKKIVDEKDILKKEVKKRSDILESYKAKPLKGTFKPAVAKVEPQIVKPAVKLKPEKILPAPRVPEKWVKKVQEYQKETMAHIADNYGMSYSKFLAKVDKRVKSLVRDSNTFVRVSPKSLSKILRDERFKTQFETGFSGGGFGIKRRAKFEELFMGVSKKIDVEKRPIYGYLSDDPMGWAQEGTEGGLIQYGEVSVKLKNKLSNRTTFTMGDSMDTTHLGTDPTMQPLSVLKPSYKAGHYTPQGFNPLDIDKLDSINYFEAQVHGGVELGDIEEIFFLKKPPKSLISLLSEKKVKWSVVKEVGKKLDDLW